MNMKVTLVKSKMFSRIRRTKYLTVSLVKACFLRVNGLNGSGPVQQADDS